LNKLIYLLAFSILLLVPVGFQEAFADDILYGARGDFLITIDKTTGGTDTSVNAGQPIQALAFDEFGTLYGTRGDFLITINKNTGGAITSVNAGQPIQY